MELLLGSIRRTSVAAPCRVFVGGEHLQAAACGTVYPPPNFSVHTEKKRKLINWYLLEQSLVNQNKGGCSKLQSTASSFWHGVTPV